MPRLKYYNTTTSEWESVVVGGQGETGPGVAAGGTAGQILSKVDGTDYNTEWSSSIDGANIAINLRRDTADNWTTNNPTLSSGELAFESDTGLTKVGNGTSSWTSLAYTSTSTIKQLVAAGETLTRGQAVYASSSDGTHLVVSKASNATEATSSKTLGLINQSLASGAVGRLVTEGTLNGLNTSSATAGDPVWLGTGGNLIYGLAGKPKAPAHLVFIGIVTVSHATNGSIYVRPQNGFELDELHDVSITSPAAGEIIARNSANTLWENQTLAEAGVSAVGHTHDDRYYTETETDNLLNAKAALSGATFTGDVNVATKLYVNASSGDEGGEIFLNKPATGTSINTGVNIDVYQNRLRIWEAGSPNRGYYLDMTKGGNSVGTNLSPGLIPIIPGSVSVGSGSYTVSSSGVVTFTGASLIDLNDVFTTSYRNYMIKITGLSSVGDYLAFRMMAAGSQDSQAQYYTVGNYISGGSSANAGAQAADSYSRIGYMSTSYQNSTTDINIFNPKVNDQTTWNVIGGYSNVAYWYRGLHNTTNSFDGVRILPQNSGTFTGRIQVLAYAE